VSGIAETKTSSSTYPAVLTPVVTRAIGGLQYDWLMSLVSLVFVAGLYLDGWAHNHGRVDDRFLPHGMAFFIAALRS
jgi:hypothetical protein